MGKNSHKAMEFELMNTDFINSFFFWKIITKASSCEEIWNPMVSENNTEAQPYTNHRKLYSLSPKAMLHE
jgi:hypothetical protein